MQIGAATRSLAEALEPLYGPREAAAIADRVMEHVTGMGRMQRSLDRRQPLDDARLSRLEACRADLLRWRPVQYVTGEEWFCGLRLMVDERVLIPRPETEELVQWVLRDAARMRAAAASPPGALRILDIGTGSGCIAIALAKALPEAEVAALDVSAEALELAAANARAQAAQVRFERLDILGPDTQAPGPRYDVIVSNPPYVKRGEASGMRANVVGFEPPIALFVEDPDPLRFYRAIAEFAVGRLRPGGVLRFETHEDHAEEVVALLKGMSFTDAMAVRDMFGAARFAGATLAG